MNLQLTLLESVPVGSVKVKTQSQALCKFKTFLVGIGYI